MTNGAKNRVHWKKNHSRLIYMMRIVIKMKMLVQKDLAISNDKEKI